MNKENKNFFDVFAVCRNTKIVKYNKELYLSDSSALRNSSGGGKYSTCLLVQKCLKTLKCVTL